ncbi:hypothetical protein FQR65_LT13400 [Abscondita terminalis]|nr:hypothetical protein FQR65_LT13400 [Abscondita terminalis]
MNPYRKWKRSASVIVTAKDDTHSKSSHNFVTLTLERVSKSSTYPGATVFPGGVLESADKSKEWLALYDNFGFNLDSFNSIKPKISTLYIFQKQDVNEIPPYISLRIAAIRETFEETGILICRRSQVHYEENTCWANFIVLDNLLEWQNKICNDAWEFIKFCRQFAIYPDVWSLQEWSNWQAPPTMSFKFDVIFFLAAFRTVPPTHLNVREASHLHWDTPSKYLQQFKAHKLLLLIPQFYEMGRMRVFSHIEDLAIFAQKRARHGTVTFMSYRIFTDEQFCIIFPGDDLYPATVDITKDQSVHLESVPETHVQHRVYVDSLYDMYFVIKNFKPPCNHVIPLLSKL